MMLRKRRFSITMEQAETITDALKTYIIHYSRKKLEAEEKGDEELIQRYYTKGVNASQILQTLNTYEWWVIK